MRTYAAEIAAKLQDAHERRTRGEDEDMSESEAAKVAGRLQRMGQFGGPDEGSGRSARAREYLASIWDADPLTRATNLIVELGATLHEIEKPAPLHELADADQVAHEVEELRQQLEAEVERSNDLARQLNKVEGKLMDASVHAETAEVDAKAVTELLATAYVAREVPWTDVAAGMMTLSREEHPRPWMVELVHEGPPLQVFMRNGQDAFAKDPAEGETVRVLVPYVTPEQAEALVASELGGRA